MLGEAKMFREKKLPCDALIYLGTGFCPSGWNTQNGSFSWNAKVFPHPKEMIAQLHEDHFKVVLHSVIMTDALHGTVYDRNRCPGDLPRSAEASCYWGAHHEDFAMGVDGWWPDEGDPSTLRHALFAIACIAKARRWIVRTSGRMRCIAMATRECNATHRFCGPVTFIGLGKPTHSHPDRDQHCIEWHSILGHRYWWLCPHQGVHQELYLRWFQFGSFCTLFRCHGRNWKLRLPWGWNTGDPGPIEIKNYEGAAIPDASQLHNAQVEPICRKYLELRYRMLPYIYSAVRECTQTGMPIMRGLWLSYSDDSKAVARSDEYLWGRDVLVAPVIEQGATSRNVYLRADFGMTSGPMSVSMVAARSHAPWILRRCRCTCAPVLPFRLGR